MMMQKIIVRVPTLTIKPNNEPWVQTTLIAQQSSKV